MSRQRISPIQSQLDKGTVVTSLSFESVPIPLAVLLKSSADTIRPSLEVYDEDPLMPSWVGRNVRI